MSLRYTQQAPLVMNVLLRDCRLPRVQRRHSEKLTTLSTHSLSDEPIGTAASFYPIQVTPGALRRPPNIYSSTVHASTIPSPIPLPNSSHEPFSIQHPLIPTCSLILNVLPPLTCQTIIETANTLGWEPDQAAGGSAVDKTSVLAHNVVWLADTEFVTQLFERIKPFVEQRVGGGNVRGINRRFRVYRYGPKQVYRVSWPRVCFFERKVATLTFLLPSRSHTSMARGLLQVSIQLLENTFTSEFWHASTRGGWEEF
jgi:hypothetical protein